MKFELAGREIEISDGRREYAKIWQLFDKMEDEASENFRLFFETDFAYLSNTEFANKWTSTYADPDNLFGDAAVKHYVSKARELLAGYKIYTIADSEIFAKAIAANNEDADCSLLQTELASFALEVFDAAEDHDDSVIISRIRKAFASDRFEKALRSDIRNLEHWFVETVSENGVEISTVSQNDADKAIGIYQNLKDGNITGDERAALIAEMIELDPTEYAFYKIAFEKLSEARYELARVAKYVNADISGLIAEYLENKYNVDNIKTEEQAVTLEQEMRADIERFGLISCPAHTKLKMLIARFDEEARTYKGRVYATREERAAAAAADAKAAELCGHAASHSRDECIARIEKLKAAGLGDDIVTPYIKALEEQKLTLEKKHVEGLCVNIENMTEAECNELKGTLSSLGYNKSLLNIPFSRIDKRITAIWKEEDFEKFEVLYLETDAHDKAAVQESIHKIKSNGRTDEKMLFVDALMSLTDENIQNAAKYAIAKEKGMLSSMINFGKSGIYNTLTLSGRIIHPVIKEAMEQQKQQPSGGKSMLGGLFGKLQSAAAQVKGAKPAEQSAGARKFCDECGTPLGETSKFCPGCGKKTEQ